MKKILSLALVAVMLFSTMLLTSCDVAGLLEQFGFQTFETTPQAPTSEETTIEETTPEETAPVVSTRYTITQEEWEVSLNSTNYTFVISTSVYAKECLVADNAVKQTTKYGDASLTVYAENKNGTVYQIQYDKSSSQWVAIQDEDVEFEWNVFLGKNIGLEGSDFFKKLQYNEETKSYIAEEDGDKAEFFFENGKLIKGTITDESDPDFYWVTVIENIGTTTVTLPEYTMAEN